MEKEIVGPLAGIRDVALAPGGQILVACSANDDALVSYTRDALTGELTFADSAVDGAGVDGLSQAQALAVSPDGAHVYVASRQDDAISVFSLNNTTGDLTFVQAVINEIAGVEGIWQNKGVAVSPDGAYVLGSGRKSPAHPQGALTLFTRDSGTGQLTFAHLVRNGFTPGVSGLGNGGVIAFSPDGAFIYVMAGSFVSIFSIDTVNHLIEVEGLIEDGVGGVDGIGGATAIAFSADGEQALVTGSSDNALAVFDRNPATGLLTYVTHFVDGAGGLDGLAGAADVVLNPAENRVYVAAPTDNAVAVFARSATGDLLFIATARDGVAGLDGLGGVRGLAISGDDAFAYSAAGGEAAIGVLSRGTPGGGNDAFDYGDAPDPSYPTLSASNGAVHAITDGVLHLGAALDAEANGQPDATASGDDTALLDDDDGVVFLGPLLPGLPADVEVTASAPALLDAWVDWNNDGDWTDGGEKIATGAPLAAGLNTIATSVPAFAPPDSTLFARFRVSTAGVAGPDGAAADGEVEDYATATGRAADLGVAGSGETVSNWNQPYSLTVAISNIGPNAVTGAAVAIQLTSNSGAVSWTCMPTNATCTAAGVSNVAENIDIAPGGSAIYTFSGTVPNEALGPWIIATGSVTPPSGSTDPVSGNNSATARVRITNVFLDGFETGNTVRWSNTVP